VSQIVAASLPSTHCSAKASSTNPMLNGDVIRPDGAISDANQALILLLVKKAAPNFFEKSGLLVFSKLKN